MNLSTMLQQLSGGMLISVEIFLLTLVFSLPLDCLSALAGCLRT